MKHSRAPRWLGHVVGAALVVATLMNGLASFAKRVGVVQREDYERYWADRCGLHGIKALWLGLGRQCVVVSTWSPFEPVKTSLTDYVVAVRPYEWPLKAAKDVVVVGLLALGAVLAIEHTRRPPVLREEWLALLLSAYIVCWCALMVVRGNALVAVAGLRSFAFLPLALVWAAIVSSELMATVARWCALLVCLECVLVPWEVFAGVADRQTSWLRIRVAGTLVHPNTLGVLAVAAVGFGLSFARSRRTMTLLWLGAVVLVTLAGSGVGWVALAVLGFAELMARVRVSVVVKVLGATALALLSVAALTTLTGRADVLNSITEGRLRSLQRVVEGGGLGRLVFGTGVGVGTNAAMTTLGATATPADSMVTLLLLQTGLLGLVLFYGLLLLAWRRSPRGRPFFIGVLIASLVSNLVEIFPVSVLLGLALGEALGPQPRAPSQS